MQSPAHPSRAPLRVLSSSSRLEQVVRAVRTHLFQERVELGFALLFDQVGDLALRLRQPE